MIKDIPVAIDENLLRATVKLNTFLFAGVAGFLGGLTLLCLTYLSLLRGLPHPGLYLNLLGVFLPGYSVSPAGAWVGFAWGGLLGAISGAVVYRIYARSIRRQVADYLAGNMPEHALEFAVLKIHGHSLGLALGGMTGTGLLLATNWLVIRGAADESPHAGLLSHYLPGYSVSLPGSVIGAVETFVIAYLVCVLASAIYNRVATRRQKDPGQ